MEVLYHGKGIPRAPITFRGFMVMSWGKIRRSYLIHFRPGYVKKSLARRRGQCHRTGACCMLAFPCPAFSRSSPKPDCHVYAQRPPNCRIFPIDERDIRDRNLVNPWDPCGFHFENGDDPAISSANV